MKWLDLLKTIKITRVSFIALVLFVGMSVGNLLGTGWSSPAVEILTNEYYDEHAVMDFKAVSADGFDEDTVEKIRNIDDVADAEGIYVADGFMRMNGEKELFSVISATENIDKLDIVEGTLPKEPNEIAIDAGMADEMYYKIGDVISIDTSLKKLTGYDVRSLKKGRFKITAIVQHPEFISKIDVGGKGYSAAYRRNFRYYAIVDESAFDTQVYPNGYSSVLIRCKSLEGADRFADDYTKRLNAAKDEILEGLHSDSNVSLSDITTTYGHYSVTLAGNTGGKIALIFAVFFFAVGLLVCYSTILRLVEEEKRLIGTKMANGFSRFSVSSKYLLYVGLAVGIGIATGLPSAFVISRISQSTTTETLTFSGPYDYYDTKQIAMVVIFEFAVMLLIAWIASAKQLRDRITNLLNNSKENSKLFEVIGKSKLVRSASVSIQSFVYNISMDSSRVIATIVGMAGSMALLIAPVALYMVLQSSPEVQFDKYFHFDHTVLYADEKSGNELKDLLDDSGSEYAEVYSEEGILSRDDSKSGSIRMIVTDDKESFEKMVTMTSPGSDDKIDIGDEGVWIWQAEGKDYGTDKGDIMKVSTYTGDKYEFDVAGLYSCYDSGAYRIFMTSDVYEKVTGKDFEANAVLTSVSDDIEEKIKELDGVQSCIDDAETCDTYYASMQKIFMGILGLVLVLSAVIAFLILLNLNIQFVKEKKSELIVMRINGFSTGAARMYIIRDNIFLSVISIVVGVVCGLLFSNQLNSALQMEGQCMISETSIAACVFGVAVTVIYMIITNIIAVWPIGRLDLTDISKM